MPPETAFLNNLIGEWKLVGQMGDTPLSQSVFGKWTLGGLFVELYFRSTLPTHDGKPPYEAVYHIGYNSESDVYVMHLLDTFGVATNCIAGLGKRNGDSIPFVFDYAGPFTNKMTWDAKSETWTFEQTFVRDGTPRTFATKKMVRRP
jgi:hypothetical protein